MTRSWRGVVGATVLAVLLSSCSSGTQAAPATSTVTAVRTVTTTAVSTLPAVTETETQTKTETATETETTVSTLDPVVASKSAAAIAAKAAAVKSSAAASKASVAAAAAAKAGPLYYSVQCAVDGLYVDFPTYKDAWKKPSSSCSYGDVHGAQFTALQQKALKTAFPNNPVRDLLPSLYQDCAEINGTIALNLSEEDGRNEAAGALMICPDHPNAKEINAAIAEVAQATSPDITYSVSGSASSASVTYSANGGDIAQENDVSVPWSKSLTISGDYSFLSISAQNQGQDGTITCSISRGGKVIKTITSTGGYAIASCSGS